MASLVIVVHLVVALLHFVTGVVAAMASANFSSRFLFHGRLPLTCFEMVPVGDGSQRAFSEQRLVQDCGTYDLVAFCAALHLATAVAHGWYAFLGSSTKWRWLEYTFSAPFVFLHTALTSGTRDVGTLVLIAICTAGIMPLGFIMEATQPSSRVLGEGWFKAQFRLLRGTTYSLVVFAGWYVTLGVLFVIMWNFAHLANGSGRDNKPPDFVYGIIASELVLLPLFGVAAMVHQSLGDANSDLLHAFLSFSSKILPTTIFLFSIYNA